MGRAGSRPCCCIEGAEGAEGAEVLGTPIRARGAEALLGGSRGGEALSGGGGEGLTTQVLRSAPRHLTTRVLRPSWHITDTGTLQTRASYPASPLIWLLLP